MYALGLNELINIPELKILKVNKAIEEMEPFKTVNIQE